MSTTASTATTARRYELDHLRVLATFGVILLHTGVIPVVLWRDSVPELVSAFNVGNAANSLGRFAVNCFFMTSGALLLDPVRRFVLRPQFLRVALPTLTWMVIYAVANALFRQQELRGVKGGLSDPAELGLGDLVRALVSGPAVYHLWFVYVLLGIYLTVPLLRALTDRPEPQRFRLLAWFLVLWFIADLLPRWGTWLLEDRFPAAYPAPLAALPTGYIGLFVLGFVLSHYRDRLRVPSLAWLAIAAVGLVWTFVGVWQAASHGDPDVYAAYDNLKPPVLMYSVGVFAFFATRSWGPGPAWPLVKRLSELSFRIYLVHVLVLHTLRYTTELGPLVEDRPVVGLPLIYVATVALSVLVAWALDFIKPLRRWI
ncbi:MULTISPECIES: acyltransferase [Aeromicrobium]|uniref:acyltransferase n=1 Tax=Aeromicrobium TaxID=2040 RepID=UPI0025811EF8|nr:MULTISPECIES: acyltransferase family protein [Aeromicrobium]